MALTGRSEAWSSTTKQGFVRDAFNGTRIHDHTAKRCAACDAVWRHLVDSDALGVAPLVFRTRRDGELVDMPRGKARSERLRNFVYEVAAYINDDSGPFEPTFVVSEPKPAPAAPVAPTGLSAAQERFLGEVRRLRSFAAEREIDHISYRPVKDGMRMIAAGIAVEGCIHAMTMHWDDADRRQARIAAYDPMTDHPGGMDAYLDCLVAARVDIYLFGEAGFGKSYWAENLAKRRGCDYAFTPMTEGASLSWLFGRVDAQGFKPTKLLQIWENGGVYLFDEADASDANMLLAMNGPIANRTLDNPVDQRSYVRSDDCILVFAGNTDGQGADDRYNARNAFDFSTFDRIRMGRANVGYNAAVEEAIALANCSI